MSIRRKSTTHDLATLRLHPDGSRVQQSSVNSRNRTAKTTAIDSRGNWIAKDAGGKTSVKVRKRVGNPHDDAEGEYIDLSGDEEQRDQSKGKQRACNNQVLDEEPPQEQDWGRLNIRTRRRLSFMRDLSFLDPAPVSVSSLEQDAGHAASGRESAVSFSDPAPELLKAIHHFASCYYRERGQLSDSSRSYRGMKKERRRRSQENIHALAAKIPKHQDTDFETESPEPEAAEDEDESEVMDTEDSGKEGPNTKGDSYAKDMYKALDGSALMAIGIVLQEYVAHTLSLGCQASEECRGSKRRRAG